MNPHDPRICAVRDAWDRLTALGRLTAVTIAQAAAIDELQAAILDLDGPHPAAVALRKKRARPCPDCGAVGFSPSGQKWHDGRCIAVLPIEKLRERLRQREDENGA